MGAVRIDDYLCLSIADLKALGYLIPDDVARGEITFTTNGKAVGSVWVETDTRGIPNLRMKYTYKGKPMELSISLRFKYSNLNPYGESGYYYFICPVSGHQCRKLYFVGGVFMCRKAFKPLYENQTQSHAYRGNALFRALNLLAASDKMYNERKKHKMVYRGRPTRWGRRCEKIRSKSALYTSIAIASFPNLVEEE